MSDNLKLVDGEGELQAFRSKEVAPGIHALFHVLADESGTAHGPSNPVAVRAVLRTSGGYTRARLQSAAGTNRTTVKMSAGQVYAIVAGNSGLRPAYLKLYDKAAIPVLSSDVPTAAFMIPPAQTIALQFPAGDPFAAGISYAITGEATDTDTTPVEANQVVGALYLA